MKHSDFDVVVVGGGHAGVEAAHAAHRLGARTALVTLSAAAIGTMSCNPAIGGLGKGHLVREIDALDGVMGRAADRAGIQFRLLNRRKGPAVQGPRAQADRALYKAAVQSEVRAARNLRVLEAEVADFLVENGAIAGVELADGSTLRAPAVVLTTGTFLRGVIHIGTETRAGGRWAEAPSVRLAERLEALALPLGRLKTGTPPRLDGRTIDWDSLEMQPGDEQPEVFSFLSTGPSARQVSCGITHTTEATHDIIRANLSRSAMYGGAIDGVGPRYCPSIEDKVVRFSDKSSHQVFLEPEGLTTDIVYPNGISTSLPADVQLDYVRSIPGLTQAEIQQPGYAIEYDYVDPRALTAELELRALPGLFLAGQINGTTGYEEAGAQGLLAGLNAAQRARGVAGVTLGRAESYIGVMIDDLVTRGVSEPYRMFTSRAEFRLSLRADNADQRLTPVGLALGCVSNARRECFERKMERLNAARAILSGTSYTPRELTAAGFTVKEDGKRRTALDLLAFPDIGFADLLRLDAGFDAVDPAIRRQVAHDALYAQYIARQEADVLAMRRDEGITIPADFDFAAVQGLSNELKDKLSAVRPSSIGQAGRIEGMTAAGLTLLLARVKQAARKRAV